MGMNWLGWLSLRFNENFFPLFLVGEEDEFLSLTASVGMQPISRSFIGSR